MYQCVSQNHINTDISVNNICKLYYYILSLSVDVPSAPGKPKVSDIDATHMTITWTKPESDGGSPIIGYFVEKKEPSSTRWARINSTPVKDMTFKVKDLVEKNTYHFRVIATNKAGEGPASEPSDVHMAKPPYGKGKHLDKRILEVKETLGSLVE